MHMKYSFSILWIFILGIIITKIEGKAIKRDVPGSLTTTDTFGGNGGQYFSFLEQMDGKLPKSIFFAAGDRINLVGFTYESGTAMAGGNGGIKWDAYHFSAGEYIKSMRIGIAAKNALSSKRVSFITFRTNFGGTFTVGKASKEVKDFYPPEGSAIAGFIGAAGNEIDRLGVIYLKLY